MLTAILNLFLRTILSTFLKTPQTWPANFITPEVTYVNDKGKKWD